MVTFGPWAAGVMLRSRRRLSRALEVAGDQLEADREQYAVEKLRFERFRLARELHDTVAHWLTGVVVQAAAGPLLIDLDRQRASETFVLIEDAAYRAISEVDRAVVLVGPSASEGDKAICLAADLPALAAMTGAQLKLLIDKNISADISTTTLRLVQEGLTNCMKHAPGAPVEVIVRTTDSQLIVEVINGAAQLAPSKLDEFGSGFGLIGMRLRIEEIGGQLEAGPRADGGWRLLASIDI
jgi:signal transduction histidine kinase